MQLANKVIIRNMEFRLVVDEVTNAFVGHTIYSNRNLYSDYNQFQLIKESRKLINMKTILGLVHIYTLL